MKDFTLAAHYTSGMIFQRERPVCVAGEARRACEITAALGGDTVTRTVTPGPFCVQLPPRAAARGLTLTVRGGDETVVLTDIYIGEVWLAGGQSNMEWPLSATVPEERKVEPNDDLRFYTVGRNLLTEYAPGYEWAVCSDTPWAGCSAENAPHFSAVGYHFAHTLYERLQVPIGIINCNLGGSSIFSWLPEESFTQNDALRPVWEAQQKRVAEADPDDARARFYKGLDEVKPDWAGIQPNVSGSAHQAVIVFTVPGPGPYFYQAPAALYYSMIEKVIGFPVKGMIWYQGETEAYPDGVRLYPEALRSLIANARAHQLDGCADYAFHMAQLAPWDDAGAASWPDFCDMQRRFMLDNPRCGLATIADGGAGPDIHPPRKKAVGERLARAALTLDYGCACEFCGPIAVKAVRTGDEVVITFTHADGLCQKGALGTFEVVSASGETAEAHAVIADGAVRLSLRDIAFAPAKARYEYVPDPKVGLYNAAGIPASVFCLDI